MGLGNSYTVLRAIGARLNWENTYLPSRGDGGVAR